MKLATTVRGSLVGLAIIVSVASGGCVQVASQSNLGEAQTKPRVDENGTIQVPAFDLAESSFLSEETRAALKRAREVYGPELAKSSQACPSVDGADKAEIPGIRKCQADSFYTTSVYRSVRERYAVAMTSQEIGGVYTEVFTPTAGIAPKNERRVLINVHGGGYTNGSRTASHLESIPIAAVGKIKVISIDYRLAPEYTFPAASEDVAAVYRELIKTYLPENVGLYGCSAGAWLTAQSMAWFLQEHLPLPGAIGMFCAAADRTAGKNNLRRSDSAYIVAALAGLDYKPIEYYRGVDRRNPLASPGDYDEVMAKFPPSLLISGTRDYDLSQVLTTHAQLVRLGVETRLHVREGMTHAFHFDPALPESREAYDVIVKFFDSHLGK